VLDLVKNNKAKHDCYVTIQFGHNDQVRALTMLLSILSGWLTFHFVSLCRKPPQASASRSSRPTSRIWPTRSSRPARHPSS
jgi:hypothetical protein